MLQFDHIGLISNQPRECESFVEATKVWVTDYKLHPFRIEWLRFEADSPVAGQVRSQAHIAFKVDDLEKAGSGLECLLKPFDVGFATVGFYRTPDGAVIEFVQYK